MRLNVKNNNLKNMPKGELGVPRYSGDSGYDIFAAGHPRIEGNLYSHKLFTSISYIEYETNISIEPSSDEFLDYHFYSLLFPRSSISNYNLALCNSVGVIDSGYRDTIKVRFKYIPQPENFYIINKGKNLLLGVDESKIYHKGDKIAQLVFSEHLHPKVFMKKSLNKTKRNKGGFGSTGK
jgi:dUTP pyrophosphatase